MYISARDNPKIKELKKLYSSKKYRDEKGLFVIEGMRGCVDAVKSAENGLIIRKVFFVKKSLENYEDYLHTEIFEKVARENLFEITEEIAEKISDTGTSQGIFVVAEKTDKNFSAVKSGGKYLILDNLQDPGNLGTMVRTADAVGVDGVILTGNCVDLYNPKTVRSAVGSLPRVNIFIEKNFTKVTEIFRKAGIKTVAAVVRDGVNISDYDFSGGCAVVIGNEGRGLCDENVSLCDEKVTIKMRGNMDSLNAAVAGTIFLWEMTK